MIFQEDKHKSRMAAMTSRLEGEERGRREAQEEARVAREEREAAREDSEQIRSGKISDQSKLLYSEVRQEVLVSCI